jgi:hypothetical protein
VSNKYALWLTKEQLEELLYLVKHGMYNTSYPATKLHEAGDLYLRHLDLERRIDDMLTHCEDSER